MLENGISPLPSRITVFIQTVHFYNQESLSAVIVMLMLLKNIYVTYVLHV